MQNFIIIEPQTPAGAHGEETFNTVEEGQTHVDIKLNEGDTTELDFVKEIAKGTGPFGRAVPKGYPIKVTIDSYEQMLEFFGIPPSTAEALDDNISKKRRRWNHMSNSGNR